jgi:hypothetical protein
LKAEVSVHTIISTFQKSDKDDMSLGLCCNCVFCYTHRVMI